MSGEILVHNGGKSGGNGPQRFDVLEDLAPGQYWRATREAKGGDGFPVHEGVVYLVEDLHIIDGAIHTVEVRYHPTRSRYAQNHKFLLRDFQDVFERELDGEAVRAAELLKVQEEMGRVNQEILRGPSVEDVPEELRPNPASGGLLTGPGQASFGAMVSKAGQGLRQDMEQEATRLVQVAEFRANWLTDKTKRLQDGAKVMTAFVEERAAAAVAQAKGAMKLANKLLQGVKTLTLYTGEGVTAEQVCDGPEAAPDEPLTLYQRKLYADEECLLHLETGGVEWNNIDSFFDLLGRDEALLNRLIPAQRGIVVMGARRNSKEYKIPSGDAVATMSAMLEAAEKNEKNQAGWLLIRNGRKVWWVFSEVPTKGAVRLFPTTNEANKPFRGWDGSHIGPDDIAYVKARADHDQIALHYRRLLVLIWGLNDRLNVFGEFYDKTRYTSFMDPVFQAERFHFVYDDESSMMLPGENRPSFRQWAKAHNALLQSGSRVACAFLPLTVPPVNGQVARWYDLNRYGEVGVDRSAEPVENYGVRVARKDGDKLVVPVEMDRGVRYFATAASRHFTANYDLNGYEEALRRISLPAIAFLCLDAVKLDELDYYLNSRAERAEYLDYIETFLIARRTLVADRAHEAPVRAWLADAIQQARRGLPPLENAGQMIDEAIRLWRAANRGEPLPLQNEPGWEQASRALLALIWNQGGMDVDLSQEIAEALAKEGRAPLRLVQTGNGKLVVYATCTEAELETRFGPHVWVARIPVERRKTKVTLSTSGRRISMLPQTVAAETPLHSWPEERDWLDLPSPGEKTSYSNLRIAADVLFHGQHTDLEIFIRPMDDQSFITRLHNARAVSRAQKNRQQSVYVPTVGVPVAVVIPARSKTWKPRSYSASWAEGLSEAEFEAKQVEMERAQRWANMSVLFVQKNALHALWRVADEDQRQRILKDFVEVRYAHPEGTTARLKEAGCRPLKLATISLQDICKEKILHGIGGHNEWADNLIDSNFATYAGDLIDPVTDLERFEVLWMIDGAMEKLKILAKPLTPEE